MAEAVAAALWETGWAWATDAAIAVASNAAAINAVAALAASQTYSGYKQRQAQRAARAGYLASLKDRELMIRSGVAPRRWVYGTDRVSGPIVYAQSTGAKKQYLHLVLALAAHQCDAIETVYFGDVALPDPDGSGYITSGPFGGTATVQATEAVGVSGSSTVTLSGPAQRIIYVSQDNVLPDGSPNMYVGYSHTPGSAVITGVGTTGTVNVHYDKIISAPKVRIKRHLGAPGQVADADLVAESGGRWTSAHKGTGITYLYVRLEWDSDIFGSTGLPSISAVVRGYLLPDARTSTTAHSSNAALAVAHWLKNADGLQALAAEVPDAEVISAANICDESVALDLAGATQPRYTFNGSFTSDQSPRAILEDMLQAMAGSAVWCQGRWLVRPGAYRSPTLTLTADHLAGPSVQIVRRQGRDQVFNGVRATYRDPAQGWAEVQAPLVTNSTYEAQDGGVRKVRSIQLASAMDALRAQRLAKIELEDARQALTVRLSTNLAGYNLAPTDTVLLDLVRYGWSGKAFAVKERTYNPAAGTLDYTLRETAAGVWAWAYGEATTIDLAPDTDLPNPYTPPAAITGLAAASGTVHLLRQTDGTVLTRALLTWTASTDAFVISGGTIQIQWRKVSGTQWQVEPDTPGDTTSAYVSPVPDGQQVLFRVRPVNSIGRAGDWTNIVHLVLGKTEDPSDVTGLTSSVAGGVIPWRWTPCPDADYEATEVRATDANWGSTSVLPLWRGRVSEWQENVSAAGTYTRYFRHFDDGGRSSTTTATRAQVVTAGDLAGGSTVTPVLSLSPPVLVVQADGIGNIVNTATAVSQVTVTEGGADVTGDWVVSKSDGPGILSKVTAGAPPQVEVLTFGSAADTATVLSLDVTQALGTLTGPLVDSSYRRLLVQPYTHASLSVAPTVVATGPAANRRSVLFNASSTQSSGLITSASDDFDVGITSTFTLEFWLQVPAATPTWLQYLATVRNAGGTTTGWGLRFDTSNRIALVGATTLNTTALAASTWHHYALVKVGSTLTAYLNGTLVGSVTAGGTVATLTARLHLGYNPAAPASSGFTGALAAIKFHLAAKYSANFTPTESLTIATADDALYPLVQMLAYLDGNLTDQKGHTFTQQGISYVTDGDGTGAAMNGTGSNSNGIFGATATRDFDLTAGDFCIEAVFKMTAMPTRPRTILNVIDAATNGGFEYHIALENGQFPNPNPSMVCSFDTSANSSQSNRSSDLALNVAYHFAMVRRGDSYYFFLDGQRQDFANFTTSYRAPSGPYICNIGNFRSGWNDSLAGTIYWARITAGSCRYGGNFLVPAQPPNSGQGSYIDVAATKAANTITRRLPVSKVPASVPVVTMSLSPASLTLAADYLGNVPSVAGATSTVSVKVNGVDDSANWAITIAPSAGVTSTLSGRTVSVASFSNSVDTGAIEVTATRSGYQTQSLSLALGKAKSAKPAQTQALDKIVLVIAGETGGKVPAASYTGATVAMTVALGGVDDTANWTFSHAASSGLTVSRTANVVSVTAMADATDSGSISITATRAGWTTVTLICTVTKTRLLPPSGVTPPPNELLVLASGTAGSATAQIQLTAAGVIEEVVNGGSANAIANWFAPTTGGIGSSYWVRADLIAGIAVSTGTTGTWQQLSTTRAWSRATVSSGGGLVTGSRLRIRIATDSAGATVVGTFQALLQTLNE